MANRLTDKQKKKIIADYALCESYAEVARKHKISRDTVKRIILNNPKSAEIVTKKKEQNTLDILDYLEDKTQKYKDFTDYLFDERLNPKKAKESLKGLTENQLVTIFGVLTDKLLKSKEISLKHKEVKNLDQINENIVSITEILQNPRPPHQLEVDGDE